MQDLASRDKYLPLSRCICTLKEQPVGDKEDVVVFLCLCSLGNQSSCCQCRQAVTPPEPGSCVCCLEEELLTLC